MGYTTWFEGEFAIDPPLTEAQRKYLQQFADTRRMMRHPQKASDLPDPIREAVGLPVGHDGEYFVGAEGHRGLKEDLSVVDYNAQPRTQPGLWCKWEPNEDGTTLRWNGVEKFYDYVEWLRYLDANFLGPWGRKLSGAVSWQGEDDDDFGLIAAGEVGIHALPNVRATDNLHDRY